MKKKFKKLIKYLYELNFPPELVKPDKHKGELPVVECVRVKDKCIVPDDYNGLAYVYIIQFGKKVSTATLLSALEVIDHSILVCGQKEDYIHWEDE